MERVDASSAGQAAAAQPPIPFNRPAAAGRELEHVTAALEGGHWAGDGPFTKRCQDTLERALGAAKVLLTTSCTDALEMAAELLETGPGDEIIVPAFTFVSTANAFVLRGATPVFVDIRPDTLNMDEHLIEALVTPRTKAIVPVHYAGVGCEMGPIGEIAARRGLAVVEDNAHGLFAKYRGQWLGTFGALAGQSFHETKNFSCGEGGALLVNDTSLAQRAEIIREKGTNRSRFFRGEVDKYTWVDIGSSHLPSDILAAALLAQFEAREAIQSRRGEIWSRYRDELAPWAGLHDVRLPTVPAHCEQSFHLFYLVMPTAGSREALIHHLRDRGIRAVFHYLPLHLSPMGRRFGGAEGQCPVTEAVSERLIRLPLYYNLTDDEQQRVVDAVRAFHPR